MYPPISDYGFISNGDANALVSRVASIDWCCLPRADSASVFGRLLDWDRGGFWHIAPAGDDFEISRRYVGGSLILATTFVSHGGCARVLDCMTEGAPELLRIVEGVRGEVEFALRLAPRFDYGDVRPWLRQHGEHQWSAVGGNDALVVVGDAPLDREQEHDLIAQFRTREGERTRFAVRWYAPETIDPNPPAPPTRSTIDMRLQSTRAWWQHRARETDAAASTQQSALVLMGLTNPKTGAVLAAATTSLPEQIGGERNWDYRFSWIRDSEFAVRSLAELGYDEEADAFRRFIERSAAGDVESLRVLYGVEGQRRLEERTLDLEGYRKSAPVRVGNAAATQRQHDVFGYLLELTWRWHRRGRSPDDDYWRFLTTVVDRAAAEWDSPDRGMWEIRGEPQHFVHSKAMCWVAVDRGLKLAERCLRHAPVRDWRHARDEVRRAIERDGYDEERGIFVRAFGSSELDSALLLLPAYDFVSYDDERMVRTVDAIARELDDNGLLRRYDSADGIEGSEGAFVACSFWLAECYAQMGRARDAASVFSRAAATANDLGLFAEEYDTNRRELRGNFPQALTHLAHIRAAVAIEGSSGIAARR